MFTSKFIPVKVQSERETVVYSAGKVFPAYLLDQVHAFATGEGDGGNNVVIKEGMYTFKSNPDYMWTLADIVQAAEALRVARENQFSFYVVYNNQKIPNLYVSSRFDTCRILVNAFTYKSVIVSDPQLVKKLSSMIGRSYEDAYLYNLFNMIQAKESGRNRYLDGVICNRYSDEAQLTVNPLMDINVNNGPWYDLTEIEELCKIVFDDVQETENFKVDGSMITKPCVPVFTPIGFDYANFLISLCDRLLEKKTDYIPLVDEDTCYPYLYLSTNFKYLVKASTFECATINNINLRDWILSYTQQDSIPRATMDTMWKLVDVMPQNG